MLQYEKELFDENFDKHTIISPGKQKYYRVSCWKGGIRIIKAQRLHKITILLKYGRIGDLHIHHKDSDVENNLLSNLELLTNSEHSKIHLPVFKGRTYQELYGDRAQEIAKKATRNCHTPEAKKKYKKSMKKYWATHTSPNCKKVICVETGKIYDSMSEAEKAIGVVGIYISIKYGKRCGGYHWEFINKLNLTGHNSYSKPTTNK